MGGSSSVSSHENADERAPLIGVGPLVDQGLHLAAALEDRARPGIEQDGLEALQPHVAEVALVDAQDLEPAAIALRRAQLELARAAVIAVYVALEKLAPFGTQLCALAGGAMTAAGLALALCAALS